jgi:hypothetical protein
MRQIYLNKDETIFYISGFVWNDFSLFLGANKKISLNLLVLNVDQENKCFNGPVIHRLINRFDKPFDKIKLFTTWNALNKIIGSANYWVYEYDFNLSLSTQIYSITPTEIIIKTNGKKSVKDEITKLFLKKNEIINLLDIACLNRSKIVRIDDDEEVVTISKNIENIEEFLLSRGRSIGKKYIHNFFRT